jgi:hypothetical protein
MRFVSFLAYVTCGLQTQLYGQLYRFRGLRCKNELSDTPCLGHGGIVYKREVDSVRRHGRGRTENMRNNFDCLEYMVKNHQGVDQHEDGLWDLDWVGQAIVPSCGFEVLDAVIRNISNSTSGERWDLGKFDIFVPFEFLLESDQRITLEFLSGASFQKFEGI